METDTLQLSGVVAALVVALGVPMLKYGWAALEAWAPAVAAWKADAKVFSIFVLSYGAAAAICAIAHHLLVETWLAAGAAVFVGANVWHRAGTANGNGGTP